MPRYLNEDSIERIISSDDTSTPHGVHDRAILLLLSRLALRAGDVAAMYIDDVNWFDGTVRAQGKGRREVRLPLPQDLGDSILEYLENVRPKVQIKKIFLCVNAIIDLLHHQQTFLISYARHYVEQTLRALHQKAQTSYGIQPPP